MLDATLGYGGIHAICLHKLVPCQIRSSRRSWEQDKTSVLETIFITDKNWLAISMMVTSIIKKKSKEVGK